MKSLKPLKNRDLGPTSPQKEKGEKKKTLKSARKNNLIFV